MKPHVKYGLILSAINIIWMLIIYILGLSHTLMGFVLLFISIIFTIIVCVLSIRESRKSTRGYISYGSAFQVGFLTIFISGLIGTAFNFVYVKVIDTTYVEYTQKELPIQIAEKFGAPEATLDAMREKLDSVPIPDFNIWQLVKSVISVSFIALIISLIIAAIMKKNNPDPFGSVAQPVDGSGN